MLKKKLNIKHIPAILWGNPSKRLILAVHGLKSNKEDDVISVFAECAASKGYQVLSFDLPEHGAQKNGKTPLTTQSAVGDLKTVLSYANELAGDISVFACSLGAYYSLMAYHPIALRQAWFLSPLVDMARMIHNMMTWFNISEDRLQAEREIVTPVGQTMYWEDCLYVKENPLTEWDIPTAILYGAGDETVEFDTVEAFARRFHADLAVWEQGEHYFHTQEQLSFFRKWCESAIKSCLVENQENT